ncbi:MAG: hypothetical protein ACPIA7_07110 [Akkermansiaceae bacterium]
MSSQTSISTLVSDRIELALRGKPILDDDFNALALKVFEHQYEQNRAYHNYCLSSQTSPDNVNHWRDIPALPTDAFKIDSFPLVTFPIQEAEKTFLTSGTTSETRGMHHFSSTKLYDQSITNAWHELDLPNPTRSIFLTPHPIESPQSSLSHMMGVISDSLAKHSTWLTHQSESIDLNKLIDAIKDQQPVALFGTALSFLHLFDSMASPLKLPKGSWAMETGGYKGTKHQLTKEQLHQLFNSMLDLESDSIINEYSMTELSSQFYSQGLNRPHQGPSWTRVRILDPLTNKDARPGDPGHLVIYDLANADSVMAIRTQDLAIHSQTNLEQKNTFFKLLGRDPSALPRGCSRSSDESLSL